MSNEKKFKYEYKGNGFNNKRDYWNFIVRDSLSVSGIEKMTQLDSIAYSKIEERNEDKNEKQIRGMIHLGFRNTQTKKLSPNLKEVLETLTEKGRVDLVVYSIVNGGVPISYGSHTLYRKDFDSEIILPVAYLEDEEKSTPNNNAPVERKEETPVEETREVRQIISDSIDGI